MTAKIQMRRDTKTNWDNASPPPTLAAGEIGVELNASNVPQAIKIGSGATWASTPYFAGIPVRTATADFNTMSGAGIYHLDGSPVNITNGPSGDLALVAGDGDCILIVFASDANRLQLLFTTGNGTLNQKAYSRVYDGDTTAAWRAWTPLTTWWDSNSNATSITIKDLTVKDDATVDDNLTVNGTSSFNATVSISNDLTLGGTAQLKLPAGTASNPTIRKSEIATAGIFFPTSSAVAIAGGNFERFRVTEGQVGGQTRGLVTFPNTTNVDVSGTLTAHADSWPQCWQFLNDTAYSITIFNESSASRPLYTNTTNLTIGGKVNPNWNGPINLRKSTNKALITFRLSFDVSATGAYVFVLTRLSLNGDRTEIGSEVIAQRVSGIAPVVDDRNTTYLQSQTIQYLDSPGTTDDVRYELFVYGRTNANLHMNSLTTDAANTQRGRSTMIIQEFFA